MATLVDGLGQEELGGTGDTGSKVSQLWITGSVRTEGGLFTGDNVSGTNANITGSVFDGDGQLRSVFIENATELGGYKIKAGSITTGNSASGLVNFASPFANADWFMTVTPRALSNSYLYDVTDGSGLIPMVSGLRRASGCWLYAGSQTELDWIAVGL